MKKAKILFVCQEITPYVPETEMSMIGRHLPPYIQDKGCEIRCFMPRYGIVNERRHQLHEVIRLSGMNIIIDDSDHPLIIKVASIQPARMQIYFIDNEDYFQRKFILKDDKNEGFPDNDERAIFFAKGVLETVKKLRWSPDLVHCQGWITSLVPLYLKKAFAEDPLFHQTKVITSISNDEFDVQFPKNTKSKVKVDGVTEKEVSVIATANYVTMSKLAINMSDGIIWGSEKIHPELETYLTTVKKPVLPFQRKEVYQETYSEFFDLVLNTTELPKTK